MHGDEAAVSGCVFVMLFFTAKPASFENNAAGWFRAEQSAAITPQQQRRLVFRARLGPARRVRVRCFATLAAPKSPRTLVGISSPHPPSLEAVYDTHFDLYPAARSTCCMYSTPVALDEYKTHRLQGPQELQRIF